jgi:predicted MPP superfamily phosphohydrolase
MLLVVASVLVLLDVYIFQSVRFVFQQSSPVTKRIATVAYWLISAVALASFFYYNLSDKAEMSRGLRTFLFAVIFINYASKFFGVLALVIDDVVRLGQWAWAKLRPSDVPVAAGTEGISRSDFLVKTSLVATAVPALAMTYGIISGAHDYRVRRVKVPLKNLPPSFDGLRIGQLSDIHSGSFYNKTAVQGGVDMLMQEKPDLVFFTGDLVNNQATEIKDYFPIFRQVKAPLGVFSTLGNHDYGDYIAWPSPQAKQQNLEMVKAAHREMDWDLLLDEHRMLSEGDGTLAIIGIENWGAGRFAKYGNLAKAHRGTDGADAKLLLSHDPSHWDAQVRPSFPDIDLALAGHTHGMQFGVEVGGFRWSPAQYVYKQWAGLYQEEDQFLYVNRGYGYLAFPGRIGMPPEITVLELTRA